MSDCIILGVMLRRLGFSIWLLLSLSASADQTQIPDYRTARGLHWTELYPNGGWTLYCGESFQDRSGLSVEHIYPASWMAEYLDCGSRKQCRKNSERFNLMEADMHNLYPSLVSINQARSNYQFSMIEGEAREF